MPRLAFNNIQDLSDIDLVFCQTPNLTGPVANNLLVEKSSLQQGLFYVHIY